MHLQILYVSVYSYTGVVDLSRGALHMVPGCVVLSLVYCYVEGVALFIQVDYASMSYAYITHWCLCVIPIETLAELPLGAPIPSEYPLPSSAAEVKSGTF